MKYYLTIMVTLTSFISLSCSAMFIGPTLIPIDRIVINTKAYIEKHPDNSRAYYTLGRAYYLGFFNKSSLVPGFPARKPDDAPTTAPSWMIHDYIALNNEAAKRALAEMGVESLDKLPPKRRDAFYQWQKEYQYKLRQSGWKPKEIPKEEALSYAHLAHQYFMKAIDMDSSNALYHLGMASLYEQALQFLKDENLKSEVFQHVDKKLILDTYWKAFEQSITNESKLTERPMADIKCLVGYESGKAWIRLGGHDPQKEKTINSHLEFLGNLKYGVITPLVISDNSIQSPRELVLNNAFVKYDLDGNGDAEHWKWVTPETGILVWDPLKMKQVTSGRQMFGNYTFQIFWDDGFHALSSLDDNGDYVISNHELTGLSVWYDLNSNGISEMNEVKSLFALGITALKYGRLEMVDGTTVNKKGVIYRTSSPGHLWDWISEQEPVPGKNNY